MKLRVISRIFNTKKIEVKSKAGHCKDQNEAEGKSSKMSNYEQSPSFDGAETVATCNVSFSNHGSADQKRARSEFEDLYPEQCSEYEEICPEQSADNKAAFIEYEDLYPEESAPIENEPISEAESAYPPVPQSTPRRSSLKAGFSDEKLYVATPTSEAREKKQKEAALAAEQELEKARHEQMQKSTKGGKRRRSSIGHDAPFQPEPADDRSQVLAKGNSGNRWGRTLSLDSFPVASEKGHPTTQRSRRRRASISGSTSHGAIEQEVVQQPKKLSKEEAKEMEALMKKIRAFDEILARRNPLQLATSS